MEEFGIMANQNEEGNVKKGMKNSLERQGDRGGEF
jgi:hypothetical protein